MRVKLQQIFWRAFLKTRAENKVKQVDDLASALPIVG